MMQLWGWLVGLSGAVLMHPVHETLSEMQWNADTRCVEVALRLDMLDEQWIAETVDASVDESAGGKAGAAWRIDHLRRRLRFGPAADPAADPPPRGLPIRWVGRQSDGGYVWWFFEVECKSGQPPETVRNAMLFRRSRDFQHRIVLLGQRDPETGKERVIVLTDQRREAPLKLR